MCTLVLGNCNNNFVYFSGLFGMMFTDNKEAAFAGLKMCQSISACILFVTAKYICTAIKIYVLIGLLIYAMGGYLVLELQQRCEKKREEKVKSEGPTPV